MSTRTNPGAERFSPPRVLFATASCRSLVAIRGLLRESNRAALLPAKQVAIEVDTGLLAISPLKLSGTTRDIGITLRKDWLPTKVQESFLRLLRNHEAS